MSCPFRRAHNLYQNPEEIVKICNVINPNNEKGKITLISRFGHEKVEKFLPKLIRKIKSDHRFDLISFRRNFKNNHLDKSFYISLIAKYKMPNSVLIHYWSRSIEDVILRTIFSRFKSFKQSLF